VSGEERSHKNGLGQVALHKIHKLHYLANLG